MSKHTPGPWIYAEGNKHQSDVVITTQLRLDGFRSPIAEVETDWDEPFASEQKANARLIAAAPVLLAALEFVSNADLSSQDSGNRGLALYECGNVARAAIKKATGE